MVIIGNGGGELGVRGYITAYDVSSGAERWRFYTVPGDRNKPQESEALKKALPTWSGEEWYKLGGGGGTVWDSIVFDPELDILYIGTGNGSPWNRDLRSPGCMRSLVPTQLMLRGRSGLRQEEFWCSEVAS